MTKATETKNDTSYILRILWAGWEAGRGRPPTYTEVQGLSVPMLNIAKRYLPELQKKNKQTKKGVSSERREQ
jgi:hypothetical protein